jgi:hypothetical protein
VDGVVFVADSQVGREDANQESFEDLVTNLAEHNRAFASLPHTFHWNKRDLEGVLPIEELDRRWNAHGAPSLGTVATRGVGVFEGLERIMRMVLRSYEADLPRGESLPSVRADTEEATIADAIRGLAESPYRPKVTPFAGTRIEPQGDVPPSSAAAPHAPAVRVEEGTVEVAISEKFSFAPLWAESEREAALDVERAIARGDGAGATLACDLLVTRVLASAASLAGNVDAPRDPGVVALLLGVEGRRYVSLRALVRAARAGDPVRAEEALEAYAFALEARRARELVRR